MGSPEAFQGYWILGHCHFLQMPSMREKPILQWVSSVQIWLVGGTSCWR
jgi:hypothetical protein